MDPAFRPLAKHPRVPLRDAAPVRQALLAAREEGDPCQFYLDLEVVDSIVPASSLEIAEVPLRIYRRRGAEKALPVLLYLHGGGFFCGDLFSDELQCAHYALHVQCVVVCVAYRLAPEHPFPAALTDCYRALEFLWSESGTFNLDRDLIAIGGSSAGGNLAAAVTLLARDRMGPEIHFQMLVVPALDDRLETDSAREFIDVPDFARPEAEVMWRWYLSDEAAEVSLYAAPARAENLEGLPAAYILCAGLDPLRDEGLDYAHRLKNAGVPVELHLVPSIPHGFASVPSAAVSERLLNEQVAVLKEAFRTK